ncbi:dnaJ homolog subfamily C member 17-like [Corticium candelabrum]|uniref:dnaJ homolog subfamily C member 17-like n=1 Tax=Corticium candelabrum TaxID=121492 RepID=UPI002E26BE91|nr:dnaJ homolog subfamily C member 17-like [Corticium candelabrum]
MSRKADAFDFESLGVEDFYSFLEVDSSCTEKEITKAYRKRALQCHPDKNPDNPAAAEKFQKLSRIYEILSDTVAKAVYDNLRKARRKQKERNEALDAKRRKIKEDLERREHQSLQDKYDEQAAVKKLEEEIKRLRAEGSKKVKEQEQLMKQKLEGKTEESKASAATVKVRWKAKKSDETNGGYSKVLLTQLLQKYGDVEVLVSLKRKGSAIAAFSDIHSAAMAIQNETGLSENCLTLSWADGEPVHHVGKQEPPEPAIQQEDVGSAGLSSDRDYESVVLTRMKQAQERKRLAEQLTAEDNDMI